MNTRDGISVTLTKSVVTLSCRFVRYRYTKNVIRVINVI